MGQPRIVQDMIEISDHISRNIKVSAEGNTQLFAEFYLDIKVMDAIAKKLKEYGCNDTTKVLEEAIWDMFSSTYFSASGLYRSSFMALRSALELGLAYIYFIDHNYDYLLWKENKFDLNWSRIKDESNGIVSKPYILFFCESLGEEKANKICDETKEIYRICSEYVHGKYAFMHTVDVKRVEYAPEELKKYSEIFTRVARIITTLLTLRFGLFTFDEDVNEQIRELLSYYPGVLHK